ncbi:rps1 [Symbiodinium sp. CCMP2592]|nr:rps1 [Symbiodinium sp. CCMP2592]
MVRSTLVVAVLMLVLPTTAHRNNDDIFAIEGGDSESRDLQWELENWLGGGSGGLGLSHSEARSWATKEWWYMETCGASISYLKQLYSVLTHRFAIPYTRNEAIGLMFAYATKQLDPDQLYAMYHVLAGSHLGGQKARARAAELLEQGASPTELSNLYRVLKTWLPDREAQDTAMEAAAAGCEAEKFARTRVVSEAVTASFDNQAFRYAEDGKYYTASEFKDYFGSNWMAKWRASPVAQKVARDGRAYSVSQFHDYFKGGWLSYWHEARWATQRRIAEDGRIYTMAEYVSYFGSQWQQKWAKAPVALCKECTAASHP